MNYSISRVGRPRVTHLVYVLRMILSALISARRSTAMSVPNYVSISLHSPSIRFHHTPSLRVIAGHAESHRHY